MFVDILSLLGIVILMWLYFTRKFDFDNLLGKIAFVVIPVSTIILALFSFYWVIYISIGFNFIFLLSSAISIEDIRKRLEHEEDLVKLVKEERDKFKEHNKRLRDNKSVLSKRIKELTAGGSE